MVFRMDSVMPSIYIIVAVHVCCAVFFLHCFFLHYFFLHCFFLRVRLCIGAGFVSVHSGLLQLSLGQTWVRCSSLNSSRCAVYCGSRFKAIWTASKSLEQDEYRKVGSDCGHLYLSLPFSNFYVLLMHD